jgi:quinol---cytochrome-c reductase cytochrome c subunit
MRRRLGSASRARKLVAGPALLFGLAIIAGSVLFMTGARAQGANQLVSTNPADIQAGAVLFQAHCQSCHGYQGRGGSGTQANVPALVSVGAAAADFYLSTGRMPLAVSTQQPMRHRPFFNQNQINQLVAYVNALPVITGNPPGPTIPTVAPLCPTNLPAYTGATRNNCVTLSEGQQAFSLNCAQCHQAAASGGILSKGNVVPSLHDANPTQIVEATRVGPKPMPVFSTNQLSDSQASAIARYVTYLHGQANPGGLPISHFGPVAEGFVGILAGFVALWFAARLIGTRG